MRISTKLKVAALLPGFMALAIGVGLFVSNRSIGTLEEKERTAYRISDAMSELNDLARFYVLRHEERPRRQFLLKHDEAARLIATAAFKDRRQRQLLENVADSAGAVKAVFLKLVSNYERHVKIKDEALLQEAEERLAGQLLIRSREAKAEATRLAVLIGDDLIASQRRIFALTLALMGAAAASFTIVLLGLMRSITTSLERLQEGARIIGDGSLDHRIGVSSHDEIGALARAFDRMSEKLQETTVSREELAAEVAERTAEIAESEARFRSLLTDSLVGFFIVQDGRAAFMNSEQERLFGSVPPSRALADFAQVHPEDRETFFSLGDAGSRSPGTRGADIRFVFREPEAGAERTRWLHCRASVITWREREAVLVNMVDITQAKEMERIALVQEKMASLGHVAAGIAHEIRNPLSGINLYISHLENALSEAEGIPEDSGKTAGEILEMLKRGSAKIESVIQRVMNFTRSAPPCFSPTDINRCIREAARFTEVSLRKSGFRLKLDLKENLPACHADERLIEQVLLNLLTNAAQAMENTEGAREVKIASRAEDDHIVVTVGDSGPGVPLPLRDKIFDPFYTTRSEGTGIGLSISHRIVTDHKGTITVGSSRMGGAEFRIRLPASSGSGEAEKNFS